MVRVANPKGQPVRDAVAVFQFPEAGASATFPDGSVVKVLLTNANDEAIAEVKSNEVPGTYDPTVTVNYMGQSSVIKLHQENAFPYVVPQPSKPSSLWRLKKPILIAAAAGALVALARHDSTTPPSNGGIPARGGSARSDNESERLLFRRPLPSRLWLYRRSDARPVAAVTVPVDALPLPLRDIRGLLSSDSGDLVLQTDGVSGFRATPHRRPLHACSDAGYIHALRAPGSASGLEPGQGSVIALHSRASFAIEPLLNARDTPGSAPALSSRPTAVLYGLASRMVRSSTMTFRAARLPPTACRPVRLAAVIAPGVFLWDEPDHQMAVLDTTQFGAPRVLLVPSAENDARK